MVFLLLTELCHVLGLLCGCTLHRCPYYFFACWWPPVGPITFCAVLESFHVNASSIASSTRSSITFFQRDMIRYIWDMFELYGDLV